MRAKKDLHKLFAHFFLILVYCLLGAVIFYAIEHKGFYKKELARKRRLYNKTKAEILIRFGLNESEFETLVENVVDARSPTPSEWTFLRGIDLCWQTVTTIGQYKSSII